MKAQEARTSRDAEEDPRPDCGSENVDWTGIPVVQWKGSTHEASCVKGGSTVTRENPRGPADPRMCSYLWRVPVVLVLVLAGCARIPPGPSVLVLPGTGKSLEQVQADNGVCQQWAGTQTTPGAAVTYGDWYVQRQYDIAYQQCMYARGNQVPFASPVPPGPTAGSAPPPPPQTPGAPPPPK